MAMWNQEVEEHKILHDDIESEEIDSDSNIFLTVESFGENSSEEDMEALNIDTSDSNSVTGIEDTPDIYENSFNTKINEKINKIKNQRNISIFKK